MEFSHIVFLLISVSALLTVTSANIEVHNGNMPNSVKNYGAVNMIDVPVPSPEKGTVDSAQGDDDQKSGIVQSNAHVGRQANVGLRKRRSIEQFIDTVNKQVNMSKREVKDGAENIPRTKRFVENIHHIGKQVNVDMGNRRRAIIEYIDTVNKQINQSR